MNKNFLRLTFILFVICAISTALVVAAYDYTNGIIADRAAAKVAEGYKQVLPQAGKLEKLPVPANSPINAPALNLRLVTKLTWFSSSA